MPYPYIWKPVEAIAKFGAVMPEYVIKTYETSLKQFLQSICGDKN